MLSHWQCIIACLACAAPYTHVFYSINVAEIMLIYSFSVNNPKVRIIIIHFQAEFGCRIDGAGAAAAAAAWEQKYHFVRCANQSQKFRFTFFAWNCMWSSVMRAVFVPCEFEITFFFAPFTIHTPIVGATIEIFFARARYLRGPCSC